VRFIEDLQEYNPQWPSEFWVSLCDIYLPIIVSEFHWHLAIAEDKYLENVPGTALLSDLGLVHGRQVIYLAHRLCSIDLFVIYIQVAIDKAASLKRGVGKESHIILIPQPSDDPNDPFVFRSACSY